MDEGVEGHFLCRLFLWEDQQEGKCNLVERTFHMYFNDWGKKQNREKLETAYNRF